MFFNRSKSKEFIRMVEESKTRLMDILLYYGIHEDLKIEQIYNGHGDNFLNNFRSLLSKRSQSGDSIEAECLLYVICELSKLNSNQVISDALVGSMIELFQLTKISGKSIDRIIDVMRRSSKYLQSANEK